MDIFTDDRIKKVIEKLADAIKLTKFEGKVYIVGGAVRDTLLGRPVEDIDVVVEEKDGAAVVATILAVKEKCHKAGRNPLILPSFGTATLRLPMGDGMEDIHIDFVHTRKEKYHPDSRNPIQEYGTIQEDAKRRDLTINSLYYNITDRKLYDFNQGYADMLSQTIRTPSDPYVMFSDDPLRILRAIRFACRHGWGIEKNTWLAMVKNAPRISIVSQERITEEISKIVTGRNASAGIRRLMYCGLLGRIMPDIRDLTTVYESKNPMVTSFDHTMRVLDAVQPNIESRMAALFHDVGNLISQSTLSVIMNVNQDSFSADVAAADLRMMKFRESVVEAATTAIRNHRAFDRYKDNIVPSDRSIRRFMKRCGNHIGTAIDLMNANNLHRTYGKKNGAQVVGILNKIDQLCKVEEDSKTMLPVTGNDLMSELGVKRGPIIGKMMTAIRKGFTENPGITREECLDIAREVMAKAKV